jgi:outer membrane receptor protein involved in Fe transport
MFYEKFLRSDLPNYQNQYHEQGDKAAAVMYNWYGVDWAGMGQQYFNNPQQNWNSTIVRDYAREFSLFADISYIFDLGDMGKLELNGGIRRYDLEDETIAHDSGIWTSWDAPWVPSDSVTGGAEDGNRYKFSASWRPEENMSVYALYSEGYRPGGNNGPLAGDCQNDPNAKHRKDRYSSDEINNYELGLKASVLDRTFDFAAAVYFIDWKGIKTDVYMDTCGFSYTANAGTAESKGFEFESTAHLTDDLKMTFNTSYTSSEMTQDNDSVGAKKGDDMTMVPEWNGYLAFDQGFSILGKEASIRADWTYYGEYKTHFNVKPEDVVPSYNYVNLSARYEVSDDVRLSVHINNIFDKEAIKYKRARSRSDSTVAQQYIDYLEGRSLTVRLDYTFF